MIRKIRRTPEMEVNLVINDENFIRPPQDSQRNYVLNRSMKEFVEDLNALHRHTQKFSSSNHGAAIFDRSEVELGEDNIMEDWQIPIMRAMAKAVGESKGDILEIGFGKGISSAFIQDHEVRSHTILECNDSVIERFQSWKSNYNGRNINIVPGMWQDTINDLPNYDGIFFHTYPLNQDEYAEYVAGSITFAEHFFPYAAAHLKLGGAFTYLSNEIDSLSREHQRLILKHFSSFTISVVELEMPDIVKDTWFAKSMVVVKAVK